MKTKPHIIPTFTTRLSLHRSYSSYWTYMSHLARWCLSLSQAQLLSCATFSPPPQPPFPAQKPKDANQLGTLRNRVAPLGFCFKNNDLLSTAIPAGTLTPVPDLETPGDQGLNQNREPLTHRLVPWRYWLNASAPASGGNQRRSDAHHF